MVPKPTYDTVQDVSFGLYSPEEIRRLAVCEITNPLPFDQFRLPIKGGLYDPRLGPLDIRGRCETCKLLWEQCPGHLGRIELAVPVYSPFLFTRMFQLLRGSCLFCHNLRISKPVLRRAEVKLMMLDAGMVERLPEVDAAPVPPAKGEDSDRAIMILTIPLSLSLSL
ncbi:DNA-directed RNA pol I, largest subunit [Kipferlia bialata]|uniref:DNA-directed RNA polymerase n=1 Tax=Kipferlia bialata TaxID=797122 RepID=A0A391NZK3_9EUKA|nr:DNA-directed RNA pol I, largest subunit [Kipferlia bialata]|eukprot:g11537.t1